MSPTNNPDEVRVMKLRILEIFGQMQTPMVSVGGLCGEICGRMTSWLRSDPSEMKKIEIFLEALRELNQEGRVKIAAFKYESLHGEFGVYLEFVNV